MKRKVINEIGAWENWPQSYKDGLESGKSNTIVGDKLVYENDIFKVWKIHMSPGDSLPFHKHNKPYFWTVLNSGNARSYYDSGLISDISYKAGDTVYFNDLSDNNYFIHNLENIGDVDLVFTTVEFLKLPK